MVQGRRRDALDHTTCIVGRVYVKGRQRCLGLVGDAVPARAPKAFLPRVFAPKLSPCELRDAAGLRRREGGTDIGFADFPELRGGPFEIAVPALPGRGQLPGRVEGRGLEGAEGRQEGEGEGKEGKKQRLGIPGARW